MKLLHLFRWASATASASALALTLLGCGGGGGDDAAAETADAPPTAVPPAILTYYNGQSLPGRLMVTRSFGDMNVYTLSTGTGVHVGNEADDVFWEADTSPTTVLRFDRNGPITRPVHISFFDTTTWSKKAPDLVLTSHFIKPKLSADGRYLLIFWNGPDDPSVSNPLTIFDSSTGRIVKRGSTIHNSEFDSVVSSPAAWLPDGSYVYLNGNKLYKSSPTDANEHLIATLGLEDNLITGGKTSLFVSLVASPDGRRLAFTWNGHIWVVDVNGANLHRITELPTDSINQVLGPSFGSPTWSPDSQWVAGVLFRSDVTTAPVFPNPEDTVAPAYQVIGTTGCNSPVFVLPADAPPTTISWPAWDRDHGLRVKSANGQSMLALSVCSSSVYWIP